MKFLEYSVNQNSYQQALHLRQELLRAPLGLDINSEDLSIEKEQLHFGLFDDKTLLATLTVIPLENNKAKIRQMAVSNTHQKLGLGSKLILNCLHELKERGFKEVELNARKTALKFYEKNGFKVVGEEFIEVSIPHLKMKKLLLDD